MVAINLDPLKEEQLRTLARSRGEEVEAIARRILEDYLDFNSLSEISPDDWAESSAHWPRKSFRLTNGARAMEEPQHDAWGSLVGQLASPGWRRPVLIVTRTAAVAVRNQVVVAQVTRSAHNIPAEVALTQADGMPQDCFVNCDLLMTVQKPRLERLITQLSVQKMAAVNVALRFAMELP